jgi:hypothetical protein
MPTRERKQFAGFRAIARSIGRNLLGSKIFEGHHDREKDILSILGISEDVIFCFSRASLFFLPARANQSEDKNRQLAEDEVMSTITCVQNSRCPFVTHNVAAFHNIGPSSLLGMRLQPRP